MLHDSIIALILSFFVCAVLCPVFIPVLHRLKFGQQVRDDGPKAHLKKSGTPTMGGIVIVIAMIAGCIPFLGKEYPLITPVLLFTVCFGVIGFLDDYLKILKKIYGLSVLSGMELPDFDQVPEKEFQKWQQEYSAMENAARARVQEDELMQSFFKDKTERDKLLRQYAAREKEIYRVMYE